MVMPRDTRQSECPAVPWLPVHGDSLLVLQVLLGLAASLRLLTEGAPGLGEDHDRLQGHHLLRVAVEGLLLVKALQH